MNSKWLVVGGGLVALVLSSMPRSAQPCSVFFNEAEGPETVLAYDVSLAPEAPEISTAFIIVQGDDNSPACGGDDSCGPLEALRVDLAELPEVSRIQLTYPDGLTTYAAPNGDSLEMLLPWSAYQLPAQVSFRIVDDEGNPSQEVELTIDETR